MLEYKGQAVLLLARINQRAKQLNNYEDKQKDLFPSAVSELVPEMTIWIKKVYEYWMYHKDFQLALEIEKIHGVEFLKLTIEKLSEILDKKQCVQLLSYIKIVDKLKSESKRFLKGKEKESHGNPKLTTELNELHAKPIMLKARRAGFLDKEYQPMSNLTMIQIKALAYAISLKLNIPERKRWVLFENHWHLPHLKTTPMPFGITKDLEPITTFYEELDFSDLFGSKKNSRFTSPYSSRRIKTMFTSLIKLGYIDPETTEEQILGAFGRDEMAEPINWMKGLRTLAYFVYTSLRLTNKDIWVATGCCFTINYERINRASLKTALGVVKLKHNMSGYAPDILLLATQYNRPIRTYKKLSDDSHI